MRPSVQRSRWGDGLARVLLLGLSEASSEGYFELLFAMVDPFTWIVAFLFSILVKVVLNWPADM